MNTASAPLTARATSPGRVVLSGSLDFSTAANAYAQSPAWLLPQVSEVDLAAVVQADSAALAMLVVWAAQAQRQGRRLHYLNAPTGLRALAKSCAVDGLLGLE